MMNTRLQLHIWPLALYICCAIPTVVAFQAGHKARGRQSLRRTTSALRVDGQGMAAGSSRHLLGDILRSLQPRYLAQVKDAVQSNLQGPRTVNTTMFLDEFASSLAPLSWNDLETMLKKQQQTKKELDFRANLAKGIGPPNALHSIRLFDGDKDPTIKLYRDSAAWCPYCQLCLIVLEEKRVSYEVVKVDMRCYGTSKPEEFLEIQPSGNLPCAVILSTGQVINESKDIVDTIDALGQSPKLWPAENSADRDRVKELCDSGRESLERRLYAQWMWWLTGVRRPTEYKQSMEEHLDEVETELGAASGPFFLGNELSIVDIRFIPFVERQVASLAYFKGYNARDPTRRPNLDRWLKAMEKRPSYLFTKSDWYTHSRALPPQLGAECAAEVGNEELRDSIDYMAAAKLYNENSRMAAWVEPGWEGHMADLPQARREAVERLVAGRQKIVEFCARGAGTAGLPAAAAPLADPMATSNEDIIPAVGVVLQMVVLSMLAQGGSPAGPWFVNSGSSSRPVTSSAALLSLLAQAQAESLDDETTIALADSLDYLRARIGVPRDMSYAAAQELRRELFKASTVLRLGHSQSDNKESSIMKGEQIPA